MQVWGATDLGLVRKQNQDFYRCQSLGKGVYLAVVCDGMGGAKSGDVASRLASDVFMKDIQHSVSPEMEQHEIVAMLVAAVRNANQAVYEQSQVSPDFAGMGTTLVAALLFEQAAYIVNVGDSRCYYVTGEHVVQVTEDHSVVWDMVRRNEISEDEARHHPSRNLITRAVGTEPEVECDCFYLTLEQGEYLLLCSDGLSNLVTRSEFLYEITHDDPDDCCQRMIDIAKERGAPDNVTAVLVRN